MTKEKSYAQLKAELDEILAWFESSDIDIDEALEQYQKALALTKQIEKRLQTTENKLQELKADLPKL